jgi:hypothetical protein
MKFCNHADADLEIWAQADVSRTGSGTIITLPPMLRELEKQTLDATSLPLTAGLGLDVLIVHHHQSQTQILRTSTPRIDFFRARNVETALMHFFKEAHITVGERNSIDN